MAFFQAPPRLGNQYDDDPLLREYVSRALPPDAMRQLEPELRELGDLGASLREREMADRLNEPSLTQWDAWGNRVDLVEVSPLWQYAETLSAERGLVAIAYEQKLGAFSRVHQFAANYLVQASLDVYSCPLAMTDGAARTLLESGNPELSKRAVPRLTSRDPKTFWTSGQWMTERTGGSDVGLTETVAKKAADGWRLHGTKWFTSAVTSQMTLTLARPEGNGPGGKGLALFYLELRDANGKLNGISVNRLKDKLGTRKVPTAELTLDGALAIPVAGLADGVRNITPMLNVTRTWNAFGAIWGMRRGLALAHDYATRRAQFGATLDAKPLHVDTLAGLQAEFEGAFHLAFLAAELLGRTEAGTASDRDRALFRLVTPIAKLTTARQAMAVSPEVLESFGGAGYVEDTGLPKLLRDAQVLPIWEGTTNVLSLDTLRAIAKDGSFDAFPSFVKEKLARAKDPALEPCVQTAGKALAHASEWLQASVAKPEALEPGARRFALTLGRVLELGLLVDHAQWCVDNARGRRAIAAARRFAQAGVDLISEVDPEDSRLLIPNR